MPYNNSLNPSTNSPGDTMEAANPRCQCHCVCKRIVQDRTSQLCGPCKDVCALVNLQNSSETDKECNKKAPVEKDERRRLAFPVNSESDIESGKEVAMSDSNNLNVKQPSVKSSPHASSNISAGDSRPSSTIADRDGRQTVAPLCSCLCGCRAVVKRAFMGRCDPCIWYHPQ
ncbi:hypothetical protein NW752_001609 [Fusarium irregulare]|uniref:Uncharacterized protein n=1 Tax=Fusarium irregulare TaxID=2494466 RepID=A0A9W8PTB3_9HYPO|nr:hypothetical protein NW766_003769 [Fusarium irregulare]KAJ4026655.1 hypothetical protein NW752_001609 [Fusarium irregulare]